MDDGDEGVPAVSEAELLCLCTGFEIWYVDEMGSPAFDVCRCGHPRSEHLDSQGSCVGTVAVLPAAAGVR